MSDEERKPDRKVEQRLDEILATLDKLRDQVVTLKRHVAGENPVRDVLAFYDELWMNRYTHGLSPAVHYDFNRTVDPATVKRWLKTMDALTIKGRITRYFADRDPFLVRQKHPFNLFIKNFNAYAPPSNVRPSVHDLGDPAFTPPEHVPDCRHEPRCKSDVEHTQRKQRELRTIEA